MKHAVVLALGVLGTSAPAFAADIPVKAAVRAPMVAPAAYNWSGFYIGAQGGYGWGRHDRVHFRLENPNPTNYDSRGWLLGGHAGYNWTLSQFLLGVEGDFMGADIRGDDGFIGRTLDVTTLRYVGTLRGRLGVTFDRVLLYATGGWAFAGLRHTNEPLPHQVSPTRHGWTAGGGLEWGFMPNWSARAEYRYFDVGTFEQPGSEEAIPFPLPGFQVRNRYSTVMGGISYHFGGGAPVVARY